MIWEYMIWIQILCISVNWILRKCKKQRCMAINMHLCFFCSVTDPEADRCTKNKKTSIFFCRKVEDGNFLQIYPAESGGDICTVEQ